MTTAFQKMDFGSNLGLQIGFGIHVSENVPLEIKGAS